MKTIIVYNEKDNERLNKALETGLLIIDTKPIKEFSSDDLGTFKKTGVIFTLQ